MAKKKRVLTDEALVFAYRLREVRKKRYETARDAAIAFGATSSQWTKWENATVDPFPSTLKKLADFFKVDVACFSQAPENWETVKRDFLARLQKLSRKNKSLYALPDTQPSASGPRPAADEYDETDSFMKIASIINSARKQVKSGALSKAIFDRNMKFLADLIELASENE